MVVCYAPIDYSGDQPKDAFYEAFSFVVVAIQLVTKCFAWGTSMFKWDSMLASERVC